jgi:6-pyruvoyltetrahydropterin/6-carboxytetrahydropterin synthase
VIRGVEVGDGERQASDRLHAAKGRRGQQPLRDGELLRLPGQSAAHVNRMDRRGACFRRRKNGAIEPGREKNSDSQTPIRLQSMYSVTKRLDFCYGHRLLDYDGVCKHPHGHNAVVELEIQTEALDRRNMVADFTDIKRAMKGWIDRELDHRMILRHDDPLVASLKSLGEPVYTLDSNPTAERIARLLFDISREQGLPVSRVTVWETPTSWATYKA